MVDRYLITCEHGGNDVPECYRSLLRGSASLLRTHRGFDPGSLAMAEALAASLDAPLVASTTSRLLIDLNRSLGNPRLYSEATRRASPHVRRELVNSHYLPYRQAVQSHIEAGANARARVVHVSSHSFTPELDGRVRHADVGLLYDPARSCEATLCRAWEAAFAGRTPTLRVRRNYPYAGTADGLPSALRKQYPADVYVGVELEINQRFIATDPGQWGAVRDVVIAALRAALRDGSH